MMETWNQTNAPYQAGVMVLHNGEAYRKLDDDDQTEPDTIGGGWELLQNSNVAEFQAIESAFSSYEQRVADHKAKVLAKLQAAGLSPDAVKAVLNA
jgi:hypothetical protein